MSTSKSAYHASWSGIRMADVHSMYRAIDHIQLLMPPGGEAEARHFYGTILGLDEVPVPPILAPQGLVWFESGSVRIHIGIHEGFQPAEKAHPAFEVADLATLATRLQTHGYTPKEGSPLGDRDRFHVHDPFGNRLEFLEIWAE